MFYLRQRKSLWVVLVLIFSLTAGGCVYAVVGGLGALGGYAISPDTVEGDSELDYDTIWDSAVEIVGVMGLIQTKDYKLGTIKAIVNGAAVTIDIAQISSLEVRLRVKARKNMLPNIGIAQDVFVKIKNRARQ
ncbi:MAG: hypothetical protein PHY73_01175 [Candidatus Omnitrophica bacterium]|nr:hypothetical protein [Candidatus Omnitrophota bacterium]